MLLNGVGSFWDPLATILPPKQMNEHGKLATPVPPLPAECAKAVPGSDGGSNEKEKTKGFFEGNSSYAARCAPIDWGGWGDWGVPYPTLVDLLVLPDDSVGGAAMLPEPAYSFRYRWRWSGRYGWLLWVEVEIGGRLI